MTDRYTRKDAEAAFERLANALGRPIGHYREIPVEERRIVPGGAVTGYGISFETNPHGWALDCNPTYGGYVIEEIGGAGETGIFHPFGPMRRSARDFCDAVRFALDAIRIKEAQ